jgi:hypothetical protein
MGRVLHQIANGLRTYRENSDTEFFDIIFGSAAPGGDAGECVENFEGLTLDGGVLSVLGNSITNEAGLDSVVSNHVPDLTTIVIQKTVTENKTFADKLMQDIKFKNIEEGLTSIDQSAWIHHRLRKIDYTLSDGLTVVQIDLMNLIISGDVETADQVLGQLDADDMSENFHWLNQDRIDWIRNEIRTYLGWPPL